MKMNNQFILLLVLFVFVFIQCQDDKIQGKLDNTLWEVYQFNNLTDDHIDFLLYFNKDNLDIWDSYFGDETGKSISHGIITLNGEAIGLTELPVDY